MTASRATIVNLSKQADPVTVSPEAAESSDSAFSVGLESYTDSPTPVLPRTLSHKTFAQSTRTISSLGEAQSSYSTGRSTSVSDFTTLSSRVPARRYDGSSETPSSVKRRIFQYHQYEEEENRSTLISFSTLVLTRASEEVPANLRMTAIRSHRASRPGEVGVEQGEHLTALYQKRGATYIVNKNGEGGFIPSNVCFLSSMYQRDRSKAAIVSHKYRITLSHDEGMRKATAISFHKATTQFELSVCSRESLHLLFSDGQWVYAVSMKKQAGFLPRSLCLIVSKGYTMLHSTGGGTLKKKTNKAVTQSFATSPHTPTVHRTSHYLKVTHTQMVPTTLEEVTFSELLLRRANREVPAYLHVTVIQDYQAKEAGELTVHMNQQLRALCREGDKLFVCSKDGQMGLVPDSICHTGFIYHKDPSKNGTVCKRYVFDGSITYQPFQVMVIQQHRARYATELSVQRGEFISVLFYDDQWMYGTTVGRQAGFVPSFYCNLNFY